MYCLIKDNGRIEFYLVERKYNHGMKLMKCMMSRKLNADAGSILAPLLIKKIAEQILELKSKKK